MAGHERVEKRVVDYPRLRCAWCGSYLVRTASTQWPVRYHECLSAKCGKYFQSMDSGPRPGSDYDEEGAEPLSF